jgi:RNA polymerase sigma-70 factor (ECF subfamily)
MSSVALTLTGLLALHGDGGEREDGGQRSADGELVSQALADQNAFKNLVLRYEKLVYATALRMVGDAEEARDIAQEAFVKAHRALASFDQTRAFAPWICTIAANLARDHLRSPARWRNVLGLIPHLPVRSEPAKDPIEEDENTRMLGDAVMTLSPRLRQAVIEKLRKTLTVEDK